MSTEDDGRDRFITVENFLDGLDDETNRYVELVTGHQKLQAQLEVRESRVQVLHGFPPQPGLQGLIRDPSRPRQLTRQPIS